MKQLKEVKKIEERCDDFLKSFKTEINQKIGILETRINECDKALKENVILTDELDKKLKSIPADEGASSTGANHKKIVPEDLVEKVTKEIQARTERSTRVVVFKVAESTNILKEEVKKDDRKTILKLCQHVSTFDDDDIAEVTRLGKKPEKAETSKGDEEEEEVKPRPVLVKFADENAKTRFMKNLYKLQDAPVPYKTMSVKHDMTPAEREQEKKLRDEVSKKNLDHPNYVHLVREPPWNRHIIKVKKRVVAPENGATGATD